MEVADGNDDLLDWETLYQLPVQNVSYNTTDWVPSGWNTTVANTTWWDAPFESPSALLRAAAKAAVLGLLILATVVGKIFVN